MTRLICILAAALLAGGARADRVDDVLRREMEAQHIPGATLVVVRNGKAVDTRAYGKVDLERGVKARPEHLFEIGSITKQFTATGILMLRDAGKLSLDDAVSKYLPDLPEAWRPVTLYQLLTHTSGVPNITEQPAFRWDRDYTFAEGVALLADKPLDFAPGSQWKYSNTGYILLGKVIEAASGQSYAGFIRDRIFKPLGMDASRMADPREIVPDRALGYAWDGGTLWNAPLLHAIAGGAGAILSNLRDLAKWDAALDSERLLKKETLEQMWTPAHLTGGGTANYGFGWAIGTRNGHRVVDHAGGTPGFSTMIRRYRDDHLSIILLTNRGAVDTGRLVDAIAGILDPALKPAEEKPGKDPDPAFTTRLKGMVENLLSEKPDVSPFAPQMAAALTPGVLAQVRRDVGSRGPLNDLAFLSEKDTPAGTARRYRATFGTTPFVLTAVVAEDGRIAGLFMQPE
jgi:CubicO group peptidase (beta-lactamase class C family)